MADTHGHHHQRPAPDPLDVLWRIDGTLEAIIEKGKEALELAFQKRGQVWADLVLHGVEQKEIAEHAGTDPSDVSRALSSRGL